MKDLLRQEIAALATTIVVKVGTRVLTREDGQLDEERIAQLADQVHAVMSTGRKVVLVSSGAVGAGMGRLGLKRRPTDVAQLQAVAAVGQSILVEAYERSLHRHGRHAAQVLLTAEDLQHRIRYLNARNTLVMLLELGAVPIINENDTVAVEELQNTLGDNDQLAAIVTNLIRAPLLVLLSDVDGLFDGDPRQSASRVIHTVEQLDSGVLGLACDKVNKLSRGGMASKLEAARLATTAGENVIIASGREPDILNRIIAGETVGTLFLAQGQTVAARSAGLAYRSSRAASSFWTPGPRRRSSSRAAACWPPAWSRSRETSTKATRWGCAGPTASSSLADSATTAPTPCGVFKGSRPGRSPTSWGNAPTMKSSIATTWSSRRTQRPKKTQLFDEQRQAPRAIAQ